MKKLMRISAVVLAIAMLLSVMALPVSATAPVSKWTVGGGSTITSETSEIWVIDTVTVTLTKVTGYIQHAEKLTELIGEDGKDGKGWVNVIVGDGSSKAYVDTGYISVMLAGTGDATAAIPRDTVNTQALNWYLRPDGENLTSGRIANTVANAACEYGKHATFGKVGFKMAFTQKADGTVGVRAIGNNAYGNATKYSKNVSLATKLSEIVGDNGATGEDGVYLRVHTRCSGVDATVTISVAYPMPADYDKDANPWTVGGGSTISSKSTEYLAVDTVVTNLANGGGYIQHKEQLTDLIGANGEDGKGFVNLLVGDGKAATYINACYVNMCLVGKSDPTATFALNQVHTDALIWYFRADGGTAPNFSGGRIANTLSNAACEYGAYADFAAEGYRVAFTEKEDGTVGVRGIGNGTYSDATQYSKNVSIATKLNEIVGDGTETGKDGVYLRMATRQGVGEGNAPMTITVAYPCELPVVDDGDQEDDQEDNKPTGDASMFALVATVVGAGALIIVSKKRRCAE